MAITQDKRLLKIKTPLGKDFLLINKMSANEGLSRLFSIEAELLHEESDAGYEPTFVDPSSLLGQGVSIEIEQADGTSRSFSGIVNRFSQGTRHVRFSFYNISIVPHVWVLTQKFQSRIFQHKSVPDILKAVFEGFEVKYEIQGTFHPRNYCVQYRESDFDFAARLMEEEGIYYFFEHSGGSHKLVIANTPQSHRDCPSKSTIPYFHQVIDEDYVTAIHGWNADYRLLTGKVTLWDHKFELPGKKLDAQQPSRFSIGGNTKLESYDFPGGYARKFDGIDRTGAERASDLQKIFEDNKRTAENCMQAFDAMHHTATGAGDCSAMTSGYRFTMSHHPNESLNKQYVITAVTHEAVQMPPYVSDDQPDQPYANSFTALLHGAGAPPFRPMRTAEKPVVRGSQTATVVGPAGEEIFTDKYGRVKVQFHWDREGQSDADSSCWVRVAHNWAGKKWGVFFVPRIGMEVLVDFIEGDPDQPIITGCVYNADSMPPYTLPDEKTKSTIKTHSSKGGSGFNEIRFEDKKGSEQIFIHAEKDEDIRVKNDAKEHIGRDRHMIVQRDQFEWVKKDKHLKVRGNQMEKIDGKMSLKVGSDMDEKVGTKYALDAGTEIHLKSGTTLTIETGTSLTLKVGGNFININSAGIFIKGTMVMLNSGGAAGSGSGSSPTDPTEPKEADKAEPGANLTSPVKQQKHNQETFTPPSAMGD